MDWDSFWEHQNWGSVPEWLGAIGTIGAVAFALLSSYSSRTQLQRERLAAARQRAEAALDRKRLRDQLDSEAIAARRSAAEKVTLALLDQKAYATSQGAQLVDRRIEVRNGGSEPITSVTTVARQQVAESSEKTPTVLPKSWRIIPGLQAYVAVHSRPLDTYWRFEVQFTDSSGVRWVRDDFGNLEELLPGDSRAVTFALYD